jgi:hypothetical protein
VLFISTLSLIQGTHQRVAPGDTHILNLMHTFVAELGGESQANDHEVTEITTTLRQQSSEMVDTIASLEARIGILEKAIQQIPPQMSTCRTKIESETATSEKLAKEIDATGKQKVETLNLLQAKIGQLREDDSLLQVLYNKIQYRKDNHFQSFAEISQVAQNLRVERDLMESILFQLSDQNTKNQTVSWGDGLNYVNQLRQILYDKKISLESQFAERTEYFSTKLISLRKARFEAQYNAASLLSKVETLQEKNTILLELLDDNRALLKDSQILGEMLTNEIISSESSWKYQSNYLKALMMNSRSVIDILST